jgi:hypothetical protein
MNVFDLDQALVNDYERFARSFTRIRAPDIKSQVEALYPVGFLLSMAVLALGRAAIGAAANSKAGHGRRSNRPQRSVDIFLPSKGGRQRQPGRQTCLSLRTFTV